MTDTDTDLAIDSDLEWAVIEDGRAWRKLPDELLGDIPSERRALPLLTSMFLHGYWHQLFTNLLILYLLGSVLECFWRPGAWLLLFFGSGLASSMASRVFLSGSDELLMGAAGALAGVMAAFVMGHARATIHFRYLVWFGTHLRWDVRAVPAVVVIGLWSLLQVWSLWVAPDASVSHVGYVAGLIAGVVITLIARRMRWIAVDAGIS